MITFPSRRVFDPVRVDIRAHRQPPTSRDVFCRKGPNPVFALYINVSERDIISFTCRVFVFVLLSTPSPKITRPTPAVYYQYTTQSPAPVFFFSGRVECGMLQAEKKNARRTRHTQTSDATRIHPSIRFPPPQKLPLP